MPTIMTHAVVGLSAGGALGLRRPPPRFWAVSALCAMLPDADVLAFALGIPYGHPLGHRGFFHAPAFALLVGLAVGFGLWRRQGSLARRAGLAAYVAAVTASHGLLDALTDGGLGIALLSPLDATRYFLPWRPLPVSPIGLDAFLSPWGAHVFLAELAGVWLPCAAALALARGAHWLRRRRGGGGVP